MSETCDHTSVGMIAENENGKILLIERKKPPFGFAPPAGHVDGDESFEIARDRELMEEVGLTAINVTLIYEGRKENVCRREGGDWHYWKVYKVEVEGDIQVSKAEVGRYGWYDRDQVKFLLERTVQYKNGQISDDEWKEQPGIEPVWAELFSDIDII